MSSRSVVTVWTRWGDYVLRLQDVRPGESLAVGVPRRRLLDFRRGVPIVLMPTPDGESSRTLAPGDLVELHHPDVTYTLSCSAEHEVKFPRTGRERRLIACDVLAGALLGLLVWLRFAGPAHADQARHRSGTALASAPAARVSADERPRRESLVSIETEPQLDVSSLLGDMRCGRADMGDHRALITARFAVKGPKDNADPHLGRPVPGDGYPAAQGALADTATPLPQPGSAAPTAAGGRSTALGHEETNARGNMWGEDTAAAIGRDGVGLEGRRSAMVKRIDVAPVAPEASAKLRVLHTGLRVRGGRKPSEVGRAMAAQFPAFQACAELAPTHGKTPVQVEFEVTPDGRVSAKRPPADALEQCVERSLTRVTFAGGAPDAAHVVYPLFFVPANADLRNAPSAPQATPCDCG